ncbi:MAG TPA: TOPRIM nucleotidyl transferase/hydrolase domain-containing protein [Oculatellaceae cyanobacterium]|jgi:predicted ATP-dependent endonuclease of OLD family
MFDRLVFVEGQSDEDILREWASKLGINFSKANVGFIPMGGVRNFAHFATEATLSFLVKRQVKMWFILDRDEKEDSEVANLQNRLGQNAILKVLKKREIENYLVCPRAIKNFIKVKLSSLTELDCKFPEESEIFENIQECAEQLKNFSINKRVAKILCKPIYPSAEQLINNSHSEAVKERVAEEIQRLITQLEESHHQIETVYQETFTSVESDWAIKKLDIVPGDLLLDMVCKKYDTRFKKERDGSRLAALMNESEIDNEVCEIIHEIGDVAESIT